MRVTNLRSPRSGSQVANQYLINDGDTEIFQSYRTVIANKTGFNYIISSDWNYSRTTTKYFTVWLMQNGWNVFEIDTLKKWLRKDSTKEGSQLVELLGRPINVTYVSEL